MPSSPYLCSIRREVAKIVGSLATGRNEQSYHKCDMLLSGISLLQRDNVEGYVLENGDLGVVAGSVGI